MQLQSPVGMPRGRSNFDHLGFLQKVHSVRRAVSPIPCTERCPPSFLRTSPMRCASLATVRCRGNMKTPWSSTTGGFPAASVPKSAHRSSLSDASQGCRVLAQIQHRLKTVTDGTLRAKWFEMKETIQDEARTVKELATTLLAFRDVSNKVACATQVRVLMGQGF